MSRVYKFLAIYNVTYIKDLPKIYNQEDFIIIKDFIIIS